MVSQLENHNERDRQLMLDELGIKNNDRTPKPVRTRNKMHDVGMTPEEVALLESRQREAAMYLKGRFEPQPDPLESAADRKHQLDLQKL